MFSAAFPLLLLIVQASASPFKRVSKRWAYEQYYDVEGHRGARGQSVEAVIPAFAQALIEGVTTLELDNGLTKDGHVIVWHDESIDPTKCLDTAPAFENDPQYPYVGQYIANLTLAQVKTLDCGSLRLQGFPLQLTHPGVKLSTLPELFDFVKCTESEVLFNIESKINPIDTNRTRAPEDFVKAQLAVFQDYDMVDRVIYQSFDWRSIILSKKQLPELRTSALADDTTIYARTGELTATSGPSDWLAGLDLADFEGETAGAQLAYAAKSVNADVLSPSGLAYFGNLTLLDPSFPGYESFTNKSMIDTAHSLGLLVKPWTVNRLTTIESLDALGIDGIITDYPAVVRDWAIQKGYKVAPKADAEKVMTCAKKFAQYHKIQ